MSDVTEILSKIEAGDAKATDGLLPLVYEQLRELAASRMFNERPDHTLQGTALVHEAYLRLVDSPGGQSWENRGHFFAAAAEAMRRILVDSARAKKSLKRGGDRQRLELDDFVASDAEIPDMLLGLDEGLGQLALEDAESAELVKLRLFAGLSVAEAGQALGMPRSTAYENWDLRALLVRDASRQTFAVIPERQLPFSPDVRPLLYALGTGRRPLPGSVIAVRARRSVSSIQEVDQLKYFEVPSV